MKKTSLQKRFTLALLLFAVLILAIWFGYYSVTYDSVSKIAKENAYLAAGRLLDQVNAEFSQMRSIAGLITGSTYVQDFLSADTIEERFTKAERASEVIRNAAFPNLSASNIITINAVGRYFRFMGGLSNTACEILGEMVHDTGTLHTVIELDNVLFFCYSAPVFTVSGQASLRTGTVILLTHLDRKRTELGRNALSGIDTAVIQDGIVLFSNNETIEGKKASELDSLYGLVSLIAIEGTGLSVAAAVKNEAMFPGRALFFITSFALLIILLAAITILYRYLSGYIMLPMELRAKNAEVERQKALVYSLKKQINAHFTINTLDTVRILLGQDERDKAVTATSGLMSLVRYAYDRDELINIWDELAVLDDYVEIMNIRYGGKLKVDFDFDDMLMEYYMPRMLLQPVIENSIVHGFKEMDSGCLITVKALVNGSSAFFTVKDNGCGISEEEMSALNHKLSIDPEAARGYENIALLNIKNRLYYYFGDGGQISILPADGVGTIVSISVVLINSSKS